MIEKLVVKEQVTWKGRRLERWKMNEEGSFMCVLGRGGGVEARCSLWFLLKHTSTLHLADMPPIGS